MTEVYGELSLGNNFIPYSKGYSYCIVRGHLMKNKDDYDEISTCLRSSELDKSAMVKLLLE